ncbi:MAG: type II secretion system F family protein [Clostridia bacterium]|nr:type II secretion system F family protein [Clostridia bacterium]
MTALVAALSGAAGAVLLGVALGRLLGPTRAWAVGLAEAARRRRRERRTSRAARDALPGLLLDLADAVRAGLDLPQALRTLPRTGPLGERIELALSAYDLGAPVGECLDPIVAPLGAHGRAVSRVVRVFHETGGQLAPMLAVLADSIERRRLFQAEVQARSAEGRLSALALALLPPLVFALLAAWHPEMVAPLWSTTAGRWASAYGLFSWATGGALALLLVRRAEARGRLAEWKEDEE